MGQLSRVLRNVAGGGLSFWCAGCGHAHTVWVGAGPGPRWTWNGDVDRPVFGPSVLVTWDEPANLHDPEQLQRDIAAATRRQEAGDANAKVPLAKKICHTFVGCNGARPGEIVYLNDCTHALAGKTIPLPDMPSMQTPEAP